MGIITKDTSEFVELTNNDVRSQLVNSDELLNVFNDTYDVLQARIKEELLAGNIDNPQYATALVSVISEAMKAGTSALDKYTDAIRDRARIQSDVIFGLASSGALADYDSSNTEINVGRLAQHIDYKIGQEDSKVFFYNYTDDGGNPIEYPVGVSLSAGKQIYDTTVNELYIEVQNNLASDFDLLSVTIKTSTTGDTIFDSNPTGVATASYSNVTGLITFTPPTYVWQVQKWDTVNNVYDVTFQPASVNLTTLGSKDVFVVPYVVLFKVDSLQRIGSNAGTLTCIVR